MISQGILSKKLWIKPKTSSGTNNYYAKGTIQLEKSKSHFDTPQGIARGHVRRAQSDEHGYLCFSFMWYKYPTFQHMLRNIDT